jgi:hypothetical protein
MRVLSRLVLLATLSSVANAHAERTIAVTLGAGAANDRFSSYHSGRSTSDSRWGAGIDIDVSARVIDQLAVGVHVGVSRSSTSYDCSGIARLYFDVMPILVGATAQYTLFDRVWIAPWVGVLDQQIHFSHTEGNGGGFCGYPDEDVERRFAFGLGVGTDIYSKGRQRVGAYARIARARDAMSSATFPDEFDQDVLLSFGIAYRYW